MSDRDLKLLIRIIKFMQQHPTVSSQQGGLDDIDERLSALLNSEISEENIQQPHVQQIENTIQAGETSVKTSSDAGDEVFEQLSEENEALKEQVVSMSEMMEMTLKHVDSQLEDRLDKEKKLFEELEGELQEQIDSQQEMMKMTLQHVETNLEDRLGKEREVFKEIEEGLQEQIDSQQGMLEMTLKNVDLVFEEKLDKERKEFKEIEEGLQEEIHAQQEMMEMTIKHMLQSYRSQSEVDEILKEYKEIEENLQEEVLSQQEMMEMTINFLQNEITGTDQNIPYSADSEQVGTPSLDDTVSKTTENDSNDLKDEPGSKETKDIESEGIEQQIEVTSNLENTSQKEASIQDDKSLEVAHKVFKEYMDLPSKLKANFNGNFLAEYMHKGNSRAYLYVRPLRTYTVFVVVDSLLEGVPSIVFNSLSSMLLHHLIVERKIESTAELVSEFTKGATSIYNSIGEEERDTHLSILFVNNKSLEIEFSSTSHEMFYAQKDKYRLLSSGKNLERRMNEYAYKVSKINGRKGAILYLVSQPMDTEYVKKEGGNFMSLQEMLINTYQLDFTEQKDNLSGYMKELQPENQVDNTLIFGLNL